MPELGEIKEARDIGRKGNGLHYIWSACSKCGGERWRLMLHGRNKQIQELIAQVGE